MNGHIDESASGAGRVHYAESPHLFHNRGTGSFVDVAQDIGTDFSKPKVGRGAAFGDFDLDGDLDVVVTTNGGPAHMYRNDLASANRSVRITLRGVRSNHDGIGARVRARIGSTWQSRLVRTGSSYLSQSELPLTFGLGDHGTMDEARIEWPSGAVDNIGPLSAGHFYTVTEGKGVTARARAGVGHRQIGRRVGGSGGPFRGTVAGAPKRPSRICCRKPSFLQRPQNVGAGPIVQPPQALGLTLRQPQARHFEELPADPIENAGGRVSGVSSRATSW